jgi:hypothetical protein
MASSIGLAVALLVIASGIRRKIFQKIGKKLLIPGTAVLYFAKVLRFCAVNCKKRGVVMTRATTCREAVEVVVVAVAVLELLVPE